MTAPVPPRPPSLGREAKRRLRRPLDERLVRERTTEDGAVLRYLEGWRAIAQANAIFGEDRWGAEVVGPVEYRPLPGRGRGAAAGIYTATVRVTVAGCAPHSDVGAAVLDGAGAEDHATAYKAAVTDALKRALRHFGDQFGNGLAAGPAPDAALPPAASVDDLRRQIVLVAVGAGSDEARTREWVAQRYGAPLDELDAGSLLHALRTFTRGLDRRAERALARVPRAPAADPARDADPDLDGRGAAERAA